MRTCKDFLNKNILKRRSFLKLACLSSLGAGFTPLLATKGNTAEGVSLKNRTAFQTDSDGNKYFVPFRIRPDKANDATPTVTARVDGWWRKYPVREFDDDFHKWWIAEKIWYYDQLIAFFQGDTNELEIPNGGHHHPMLTTYGRYFFRRGDSDFHLNTAVKGFTIIPKVDELDAINAAVADVYENGDLPIDLFKLRQTMYQDKTLWDKTRFATLELYSCRPINDDDPQGDSYGFTETKTFQNIMVNPMATLNYMAFYNTVGGEDFLGGAPDMTPHYQFKGFCWPIAYYNPANTEYEQKIADYINKAHCGYHGGACDIATNIFLIAEQFNQSPSTNLGRGKRVVPETDYPSSISGANSSRTVFKTHHNKKLTKNEKIELIKNLRIPV